MITVQTIVPTSIEKAWELWTQPQHITQWNNASDDWHCPKATNDLKVSGAFSFTMASKDGQMSFDFEGTYTNIKPLSVIEYSIIDGRKVKILFEEKEDGIQITESFEPENVHSEELQRDGWQAILNNFKKYSESN
jgi:uncharacterized protein YndB with AHSA1/START domain